MFLPNGLLDSIGLTVIIITVRSILLLPRL